MNLTGYEIMAIGVPLSILASMFIASLHLELKELEEEEKECEEIYKRIKNKSKKGRKING